MIQQKFATFYLGEALFGIDILLIREINRNVDITPVDLSHDAIRGLINLRGQLITMFDLGMLLGIGKTELSGDSCCIVLKTQSELAEMAQTSGVRDGTSDDMTGFIVDRIGDIITPEPDSFEAPPASISGVNRQFIDTVVKLDPDLLVVLKIAALLTLPKQ